MKVLVAIGWVMAVVLFETFAVGAVYAIWTMAFPNRSAQRQHAAAVSALCVGLLCAAGTPILLPIVPQGPAAASSIVSTSRSASADAGSSTKVPSAPAMPNTPAFPATTSRALGVPPDTLAGAAGLLWVAGTAVLALRLAGGAVLAAWIRSRAAPVIDGSVLSTADAIRKELGFDRPVSLLQSERVEAPVVIGWRRPALVIPSGVLARIAPDSLIPLLAHEFAHIRRRDYLVNLLQSIVEAPLFFSPAILWISKRIRETREYCCDDAALRRCDDPRLYINSLMTLASLTTINRVRPALGAAGPRLVVRVRRIIEGEAMPKLRRIQMIGLSVFLVVAAVSSWRLAVIAAPRTFASPPADAMNVALPSVMPPQVTLEASPPAIAGPARPAAGAPNASVAPQAPPAIPYGVGTRDGSGVTLRGLRHTAEQPLQFVTVTNVTTEPVTGLRFVAVIERIPFGEALEIVTSDLVSVQIPPAYEVDLTDVAFPPALRNATMSGARMQIFVSVQEVRFANRSTWSMTPNPAAREHREALGFDEAGLTRAFLARQATMPPPADATRCVDQNGRGFSQGALVKIVNEPGRIAKCDAGRWQEVPR